MHRRPTLDLLARVPKLPSTRPRITAIGRRRGIDALLLEHYGSDPAPSLVPDDGAAVVDLLCSSGNIPSLPCLERLLSSRITPGGVLACETVDLTTHPVHAEFIGEVANRLGVDICLPAAVEQPQVYDTLRGPLCTSLHMWSTVSWLRADDHDSLYAQFTETIGLSEVLAAMGSTSDAFEGLLREQLASAFPASKGGSILFPCSHFYLVAQRPSLLDVYSEYAAYHNHQLDKGWKS